MPPIQEQAVCLQQQRQVLAWLDGADKQQITRARAGRGRGRLVQGIGGLVDDVDLLAGGPGQFDEIVRRFVAAARAMQADGWWSGPVVSDKQLRRMALRESLRARLGR